MTPVVGSKAFEAQKLDEELLNKNESESDEELLSEELISKKYTEKDIKIGKFLGIMSTIINSYDYDYCLNNNDLNEHYEKLIDEFEDENAGIKSVTVCLISKEGDTNNLKIETNNYTYKQIHDKLKYYRVSEYMNNIIIDDNNNLIVESS